jgi:hypothetical protein
LKKKLKKYKEKVRKLKGDEVASEVTGHSKHNSNLP